MIINRINNLVKIEPDPNGEYIREGIRYNIYQAEIFVDAAESDVMNWYNYTDDEMIEILQRYEKIIR
jgi:hypothetical protein